MDRKAIIFGIKGIKLSRDEKNLIKREKPWGIILFSRNINNIYQLKKLIEEIKRTINDKTYPILIDQEGGAVSRLNNIIDFSIFSQSFFGDIYKKDRSNFLTYYKIYINSVCEILKFVGININTVPVLDIKRISSHKIIGTRSFSEDIKIVEKVGKICIELYSRNKIATIIKHIPGHGLSKSDTHFKSSVIKKNKKELVKNDFKAFKKKNSLFAMTAHIVYDSFDPIFPATHSKIIINEIIRKHIGFKGVLISDDISMKALKYGVISNAIKALNSGCNLVLHCNANIKEMNKLVKIIPTINKFTERKTSQFYEFLR